MIEGIDVSPLQGFIDWSAVKRAGIDFAWIKSSEGTGYRAQTYHQDVAGARANGVAVGSYHFARPDLGTEAAAEADYFLRTIGQVRPGEVVALDMEMPETEGPDLSGWALAFLQIVHTNLHLSPFLYSYPFYIQTRLQNPQLNSYPLWLAAYQEAEPALPPPFTQLAIWQYADDGSVPGVFGQVDRNRFYGDSAQLAAYGPAGAPAAHRSTMLLGCGLKPRPAHGGPNLALLGPGDEVLVIPWVVEAQGEVWQRVQWRDLQGWVLASRVQGG